MPHTQPRHFVAIPGVDVPTSTVIPLSYFRHGKTLIRASDVRERLQSAYARNKKAHPEKVSLDSPDQSKTG